LPKPQVLKGDGSVPGADHADGSEIDDDTPPQCRGENRSKPFGRLAFEPGWYHAARMGQFRKSQTPRQTSLRFVWRNGRASGHRAALAATRLESLGIGDAFAPLGSNPFIAPRR
jgi:hypothetical protein